MAQTAMQESWGEGTSKSNLTPGMDEGLSYLNGLAPTTPWKWCISRTQSCAPCAAHQHPPGTYIYNAPHLLCEESSPGSPPYTDDTQCSCRHLTLAWNLTLGCYSGSSAALVSKLGDHIILQKSHHCGIPFFPSRDSPLTSQGMVMFEAARLRDGLVQCRKQKRLRGMGVRNYIRLNQCTNLGSFQCNQKKKEQSDVWLNLECFALFSDNWTLVFNLFHF